MLGIKNQFSEMAYLCSSANSTSKWFFRFVVGVMAIIFIVSLIAFVLACMGSIQGVFRTTGFAALPVSVVIDIVVLMLLNRN